MGKELRGEDISPFKSFRLHCRRSYFTQFRKVIAPCDPRAHLPHPNIKICTKHKQRQFSKKKVHETLFRLTFNLSFCYRFWSSLPSSMISHSKLFKMFFQTYSHNFLFKKIRITFCETSEKTS